jgi:hypothetical protein
VEYELPTMKHSLGCRGHDKSPIKTQLCALANMPFDEF